MSVSVVGWRKMCCTSLQGWQDCAWKAHPSNTACGAQLVLTLTWAVSLPVSDAHIHSWRAVRLGPSLFIFAVDLALRVKSVSS